MIENKKIGSLSQILEFGSDSALQAERQGGEGNIIFDPELERKRNESTSICQKEKVGNGGEFLLNPTNPSPQEQTPEFGSKQQDLIKRLRIRTKRWRKNKKLKFLQGKPVKSDEDQETISCLEKEVKQLDIELEPKPKPGRPKGSKTLQLNEFLLNPTNPSLQVQTAGSASSSRYEGVSGQEGEDGLIFGDQQFLNSAVLGMQPEDHQEQDVQVITPDQERVLKERIDKLSRARRLKKSRIDSLKYRYAKKLLKKPGQEINFDENEEAKLNEELNQNALEINKLRGQLGLYALNFKILGVGKANQGQALGQVQTAGSASPSGYEGGSWGKEGVYGGEDVVLFGEFLEDSVLTDHSQESPAGSESQLEYERSPLLFS